MAFFVRTLLFFVLCATVLVGVPYCAKMAHASESSIRIGAFNSHKTAQLFFETLPLNFKSKIDQKKLWLNAYKSTTGLTIYYLDIADITPQHAEKLCGYLEAQDTQCIISERKLLIADSVNTNQRIEPPLTQPSLPFMLRPLGLRMARGAPANVSHMDLAFSGDVSDDDVQESFRQSIRTYGDEFNFDSNTLDTPEAVSAKAAYDTARNNFLSALQRAGEGLNAGQGAEAAREQLMTLGQQAFEAAGNAYLSGFLAQQFGKGDVLASDAGSGRAFIHHVKNNMVGSAQNTVKEILTDAMSSGSVDIIAMTDALMLSGARGVIDAGLSAARRSDLYALRNLELEYNLNNFEDSYLSALMTQPIYQSSGMRHNVFLQGSTIINEQSVDIQDDVARHTLNIGAAYRYFTVDEKYLLGGNVFFDHQWPYNHSRLGLGVDAKSKQWNFAANYYHPLSGYRDGRHDDLGNQYEERALQGYDLELGYDSKFVKGLSVFGKGYQYFRDTEADITGIEISAEYNILDDLTIKGSVIEENGGRDGVELALQYRIPLYNTKTPNLALADMEPAAGSDSVRDKIFEKVRRSNTIRVEERLQTPPLTAQFNALSTGLSYDVGGNAIGAGVNLPFDTAITVPNGRFGIINFSNGAVANISASGGGDVILQFNASTLSVTTTNGGFVQFISGSGGISVVNVPGGTVNLLGTDIDVTDNGITTTVQVRAGAIRVVPDVGVDVEDGAQADIVSLMIGTGATTKLVGAALTTRQESAFTNLDLINPLPPTGTEAAPFINQTPELITGPQFVGNNADIRLTFTQPVNVTGTPQVTGFVDANARTFIYDAAASTTTQLIFRHVFIAADVGAVGVTVDNLDLNGGTITGVSNNLPAITAFASAVIAINDMTAPLLNSSVPVDNEPAFNGAGSIVLNFDENMQVNVGNIILTDTTDGSDSRIIPITDAAQVTIAGATVTINPTGVLELSSDYDLSIGANILQDTDGNAFAGITSPDLTFTTSNDVTPPTFNPATDSSPADNDTDVAVTENIVITFSEAVNKNVGNIEIRRTADNALLETIDVTTGLVTGDGTNTITINPASDYPIATDVYVLIAAGAFQDLNGNAYAGIASTTAFNFRGFAPNDVAGLSIWLDANDLDGDGAPEGVAEGGISAGDITTWVDKAGGDQNVLQGDVTRRPSFIAAGINGLPVARFNGTSDSLNSAVTSIASANGHTVFIVADINNSATSSTIIRHRPNGAEGTVSGFSLELSTTEQYSVVLHDDVSGNALRNDSSGGAAPTAAAILGVDFGSNVLVIRHDGVIFDNSLSNTTGAPPLGNVDGNTTFAVGNNFDDNGRPLAGDVSEILVFTESLSNANRQAVERYLGAKYNIVVP